MRRNHLYRTMSVVLCVTLMTIVISACSRVEIKKFQVSPEEIELTVGSTVNVDVTIKTEPKDADVEIIYTTSDESVAEVDSDGMITAVGAGDCEITVSAGDEEETIVIIVNDIYQIGDTASTDNVEITLTDVVYERSRSEGGWDIVPQDGYQFVTIYFSIRNIGHEPFDCMDIYSVPYIDYNDGYTFTAGVVQGSVYDVRLGDYPEFDPWLGFFHEPDDIYTDDLTVLGNPTDCYVSILVPNEVVNNTDAPLMIGFSVDTSDGTESVLFRIR